MSFYNDLNDSNDLNVLNEKQYIYLKISEETMAEDFKPIIVSFCCNF